MILKRPFSDRTNHDPLDLLGSDEIALSKAFSYLLATDRDTYFCFLRFLGISINNTSKNFNLASIVTEKYRDEGRTDIELSQKGKYHVIIECKIGQGKVKKQRIQYLNAFDKESQIKILCILTQLIDSKKTIPKNVIIKNTSWLEIIELLNHKKFTTKPIVNDFLKFTTKNYKMRELKEILIQDLDNSTEIERFNEYSIYKRGLTFGTPLYFAPYFTQKSNEIEGITRLSRILGILTFKPENNLENFRTNLENFTKDESRINKWMEGIKLGLTNENKDSIFTYYFLDEPIIFKNPLKKDDKKQKGSGKNWISSRIPQNRCVSFIEFIKHIPELN